MIQVGIFIFGNVELLDFCGPYEVFSAANMATEETHFEVYTFAETLSQVRSINGLRVYPDYDIQQVPQPDIMVWPGGEGTKAVIENKGLLDRLLQLYQGTQHSFSVCSGARIPAILGLLEKQKFTTHHSVFDDVQRLAPTARVRPQSRFTDNGKLLTSAGVAAGIDLSFYLLQKLKGSKVAQNTARYMEYPVDHLFARKI